MDRMISCTKVAIERATKCKEVILRALAKRITDVRLAPYLRSGVQPRLSTV
jgi:hypothetical protein